MQTQPALYSSETGGGLRAGGGTAINDDGNAGRALNATDDPKHAMLRSVVMKGFTLHAVAALEADIRRRVNLLIDDFPENEPFDFVAAFAREVPLQAICMVLGVPQEDRLQLCEWVDAGLSTASPADPRRRRTPNGSPTTALSSSAANAPSPRTTFSR